MKKRTLTFLLAISCLTFQASFQACTSENKKIDDSEEHANDANDAKEARDTGAEDEDSDFAVKAASGGLMEVTLGKIAEEKAQNPQVKEFGAQMVKDHQKANAELKALAALKNITLPTSPGADKMKDIERLSKLSGAEFDKQYISFMKEDHEEDVKEFKEAAQDAKDASIKEFAAKTLPTLQMHLDMVTAIDKKLN